MPKKKSLPTFATLQSGIQELQITLKSVVRQINERFDSVDKRLDGIDKRFDTLEIQWKSEDHEERITKLEKSPGFLAA